MSDETLTGTRVRLAAIASEDNVSAHERFARMVKFQQQTSGEDFATALRKVSAQFPELHREYLDTPPPLRSEYSTAFVHGVPIDPQM